MSKEKSDNVVKFGVIMSVVCGLILSMGAIHMDTINWILPTIADDLSSGNSTLMVTSGFFYGMMFGHIIVGPLSDMIGKKKTMLFGFAICIVGAIIGSQATSLTGLIAARIIQGVGGAASSNAARGVGGDAGKGRTSAMALTFMQIFSAAIPIILPLLGKTVGNSFGWPAIFWLQAIICIVLALLVLAFVTETSAISGKGSIKRIGREIKTCLATPQYIFFVLCFAFNMATFFLYSGSMSFAMVTELGMNNLDYANIFAFGAVAMTIFAMIGRKFIAPKFNPSLIIFGLNIVQIAFGVFFSAMFLTGAADYHFMQWTLWILPACQGIVLPIAMSLVMNASGTATGTGAAFMGFVQYLFSSITTTILSNVQEGGSVGMYIGFMMCITAFCSLISCIIGKKRLLAKDPDAVV